MDEDALAPMADALSATLAVFILLICFFVMAQVDAVSKQIDVERVGDKEIVMESLDLQFNAIESTGEQFIFFNSFDAEDNYSVIKERTLAIKSACGGCTINITSNYPRINSSNERALSRAAVNAVKMATVISDLGMDYTINTTTDFNYYFIELKEDRD
ncbi:conserved hypothetical protein [Vibrio chagasii]|nr:conserved hypothetical protein [Vibrio chagasii]